jgi:hypothetical protein
MVSSKKNKNIEMIIKEGLHINDSYWRDMSAEELENFVQKIFIHYRETGFPYYPTDIEIRKKDFDSLMKYDFKKLFAGSAIMQSMHGLGLAWSYFPHSFNVKSNDKMTPYEAFMNDEIFMNVIRKRLKMGTYIADSGIRKMLKIYTGVQGVSNFRPTAAACIYYRFARGGVVWDMSGGWGGRLLGAIAGGVKEYITTEPSIQTHTGLCELAEDFSGKMNYEINCCGSENYRPKSNSLNLCFTSPPYFDLEKYADEPTQSYIKFNSKEAWVEGFLRPTFKNCHQGLKKNGYMLINIADVKGKHNINLEWETVNAALDTGFLLIDGYQLALSNVNLRDKGTKFKYEPIYVFKKWKN